MKLKVLTLIVLLNSLLMLPVIAQESMSIKNHSDLMQIEPSATYSGDLVLELLEAVKKTAEKEIERAYEDGYKQGLLEVSPEAAGLEFLNKELEKELAGMKQKRWRDIMLAGAGGVVLGALTGIIIMAVN